MEKRILFICKYNRFRSKIAESLFKELNKNKNIQVRSAGIIPGRYPLDETQTNVARQLGIKLEGKPIGINISLLEWQDVVIIVADDVPKSIFNNEYSKKTIVWKIPDSMTDNEEEIKGIILKIKDKVIELIKSQDDRK